MCRFCKQQPVLRSLAVESVGSFGQCKGAPCRELSNSYDRVHVGCVNPDTVHVVFHSARSALVPSQLSQGCSSMYFVAPRKCTNNARGSRTQRWLATLHPLTPIVSMSKMPSCWHTVTVNVTGPKPLVRLCPDMHEHLRNAPVSFHNKARRCPCCRRTCGSRSPLDGVLKE